MNKSLYRLKYGTPNLAKALFTLAMQGQAHKCQPAKEAKELNL